MRLVAIGGSDAGIQAALRARELDPSAEVTVVLADAYPNYSICGIPYYVSGDVADWHHLAHRTIAELEATGMTLRLDTVARQIDTGEAPRDARRGPTTTWGFSSTTRSLSPRARCRSGRRSPGSTTSAHARGCTSCTRWETPSRSCEPSNSRTSDER